MKNFIRIHWRGLLEQGQGQSRIFKFERVGLLNIFSTIKLQISALFRSCTEGCPRLKGSISCSMSCLISISVKQSSTFSLLLMVNKIMPFYRCLYGHDTSLDTPSLIKLEALPLSNSHLRQISCHRGRKKKERDRGSLASRPQKPTLQS